MVSKDYPPVGYYFVVNFLHGGIIGDPFNITGLLSMDMKFQKVSGITAEVETKKVKEGGENLFSHKLPQGVTYNNLILERGMVIGSLLNVEFNVAMSTFQFTPSNVIVSLLDETDFPIANWVFRRAYPVKWSVSDLDASQNSVIIEKMELAYSRFQSVRI